MNSSPADKNEERSTRRKFALILCLVGLAINFAGVQVARATGVPLFLDIIGTSLAAALGGTIPGIVVGFLTNLINGISDSTTAYYGSLSVLIAICSTLFERNGYFTFKKPWKLIIH